MSYLRFVSVFILICTVLLLIMITPGASNEPVAEPGSIAGGTNTFKDVNKEHWAYVPVKRMAERDILNGYPDGNFKPQQLVSRSEFAAMLTSAAGLSAGQTGGNRIFADCPEQAWFYHAALAVAPLLPGSVERDGKLYFMPGEDATREDVIVALVKAMGVDTGGVNPNLLQERFTDFNDISEAARIYLAWAYRNNLLRGFPDGTLKPGVGISRAEVAAMLYRAFFIDTSIEALLAGGQIEPLSGSDREYSELVAVLQSKYGKIRPGSAQVYDICYQAHKVNLYAGEGPQVLYVFGNIEPTRYHNWEADFKNQTAAVQQFIKEVAWETARLYPRDNVLVLLGHQIEFLFDVSGVYEEKYLIRSADGWQLERFYSGVMINSGTITNTWSEK